MKNVGVILVLCSLALAANAQKKGVDQDEYDENYEFAATREVKLSLGIGLGLDYGGIGGKLAFSPSTSVDLFGAVGFNLVGAGFNAGLIYKFNAEKKVNPYITGMYGYNAVIFVDGMKEKNKVYFGPTIGTGIQLHRKKGKYWNFGLNFPIRPQQYRDDIDALKNDPNVIINSEPLPFTISVGIHFPL